MADPIANQVTKGDLDNYSFLKIVNSHFGELTGHYVSLFQPYHDMLTAAAFDIAIYGGLLWVVVYSAKAPLDRMLTALGAMLMIGVISILLSPSMFSPPGGYADAKLANGAGHTYEIIGTIYSLFKSSLDSVNDKDALDMAFASAYHVTDAETIGRFINSPMAPLYSDYLSKCRPAFEYVAGNSAEGRAAGRYVGFYGSGGIGQAEIEWANSNGIIDKLKGSNKTIDTVVQSSILKRDGGKDIEKGVNAAVEILRAIPAEANPYDGQTVPVSGYKIPTKEYWDNVLFEKDVPPEKHFYNASDIAGTSYSNTAYSDNANTESSSGALAFPKNCYDMYRLVDQAQRNWQASIEGTGDKALSTAYTRDTRVATELLYSEIQNKQFNLQDSSNKLLPLSGGALPHLAASNLAYDFITKEDIREALYDRVFTGTSVVGAWFREKMLKYVIPATINGCAMLVGFLVVIFPVICVMAIFITPKVLITFIKLMSFAFLVPFTNDLCLSMSATLLAVNNELMIGYNAGNFTKNDALIISAGTAQYAIFIALCVIELIFAKMLIWDDAKSISSFNPGAASAGLAATGGAIIGAGVKLGTMAFGGGKALAKGGAKAASAGAKGAAGASAAAGGQGSSLSTKMMVSRYAVSGGSADKQNQSASMGRGSNPSPSSPSNPTPAVNLGSGLAKPPAQKDSPKNPT